MGDSEPREYTDSAPVVDMVPIPWNQPPYRQTPVYAHMITCAVCTETVTVQTQRSTLPLVCEREACRTTYTRMQAQDCTCRQRMRQAQDKQES